MQDLLPLDRSLCPWFGVAGSNWMASHLRHESCRILEQPSIPVPTASLTRALRTARRQSNQITTINEKCRLLQAEVDYMVQKAESSVLKTSPTSQDRGQKRCVELVSSDAHSDRRSRRIHSKVATRKGSGCSAGDSDWLRGNQLAEQRVDCSCSLSRARFEELCISYFRNSMGLVKKCL